MQYYNFMPRRNVNIYFSSSITPSTCTPPLANYGILTGQLFLYEGGRAAFE